MNNGLPNMFEAKTLAALAKRARVRDAEVVIQKHLKHSQVLKYKCGSWYEIATCGHMTLHLMSQRDSLNDCS